MYTSTCILIGKFAHASACFSPGSLTDLSRPVWCWPLNGPVGDLGLVFILVQNCSSVALIVQDVRLQIPELVYCFTEVPMSSGARLC